MSAGFMRVECRKFNPNIFNKTKCSNCFRQKEEHSAEALESNRAARKISKCGYLFVAPGWDFSNPVNRTKRWQRRWFVLYDDGELSYSVDEHPETVPQASIDMNKVLEVADAEEITGHPYSLAITAPDTVHFVKGTCREEAKWWREVLAIFPRTKGRHKRNATFPGSQTSALLQQTPLSCRNSGDPARPRFNSCHGDSSVLVRRPGQWLCVDEENLYSAKSPTDAKIESPPRSVEYRDPASPTTPTTPIITSFMESSATSPTASKTALSYRESAVSCSSPVKTPLNYRESPPPVSISSLSSSLSSLSGTSMASQPATSSSPPTRDKLHAEEKARARREKRGRSLTEQMRREKLKDIADSLTRPRTRPRTTQPSHHPPPTRDRDADGDTDVDTNKLAVCDVDDTVDSPIRGDPDGCGLDLSSHRYSPSAEIRVALPAEDLLNLKKGWLMKQNGTDWSKHWFVLRGAALMYYRDPTAEDKGILDGVMDLSSVRAVAELQVQRNYGFQTVCWDERRFVLSAVTAGIRNNWMTAIRRAAGLPEPTSLPPLTIGEKLERELHESNPHYFDKPSSLTSAPSLERIGVEGSPTESGPQSYLSGDHGSPGWAHSSTPLPPSPPLTRTPISRVKERAKMQVSRSRVYNKRSRSSPPSSRRNTLDTIRVPPVPEAESFPRRQSFSKVLDEPAKSGEWTDSSLDKPWSLKLGESNLLRGRSVDSLSDLTNIDLDLDLSSLDKASIVEEYEELKSRFEKAVMEIRAMKRELRQSHKACDELELASIRLRQDAKCREEADRAEAALMAARIQDLALKLSAAEKQARALKQKTSKAESREKRRSLSLKGRESFQIGREVEEKLAELESKMAALEVNHVVPQATLPKTPVAKPRMRRKSLDSATSEPITVLLRLSSLEGRLASADSSQQKDVRQAASDLVGQLGTLLKEKLSELTSRRLELAAEGRLDDSARLRLTAERLAVESVLVRKVWDAARCYEQAVPIVPASEIEEINALMEAVRRRIRGEDSPVSSPLACLTEAVAQRLTHAGNIASEPHLMDLTSFINLTDLDALLKNQRNFEGEVKDFRANSVRKVARGLALETLCLTAEYEEGRCRDGEDRRLRDAWTAAQETLNRELVQAELSHVAMRWSSATEGGARITWFGLSDTAREAWASDVAKELHVTMDELVEQLTSEYERCLNTVKRPARTPEGLEADAAECRAALDKLVSVTASSALVNTRIRFLTQQQETKLDKRPVVRAMSLKPDALETDIETECLYLFHKVSGTTAAAADAISVGDACSAMAVCVNIAQQIARACNVDFQDEDSKGLTWADLAERCSWLAATLKDVMERLPDLQTCTRCPVLQASLDQLEKRHEDELSRLKQRHDWQLQELRGELETQRDSLVCQHEIEQAQLLEKARRLERRLGTLDAEYAQQMDNLRAAYQRTLSAELSRDEDVEDSIRFRYQAEIQQLRALCEKGLIAVDNSHRRIIAQMEEKHRQELAAAAAEKDQALAEETQATLAALDAMRKAHETEVQREVGKFKAEWLRRMQSSHDITALHRAHEEEMEEIKAEILSLSERYSDKCVESARLEEELGVVTKQLAQAQQTCVQLDARNRQLRAHLVADTDEGPLRIQEDLLHEKISTATESAATTRPLLSRFLQLEEPEMSMACNKDGSPNRVRSKPLLTALPSAELLRCRSASPAFASPTLVRLSGMVAERMKVFESRC